MSSSPITRPARRIGSDPASLRIARHVAVLFLALVTVYPFLLVVVSSLTPESDILINGFRLLPASLTTDAYRALFADFGRIAGAYRVTATVTLLGTGAGLSVSALIAYPLSLRHLRGRSMFNLFVLFPLLFSGGMVPWYIVMTRYLGLRNSLPALILPIMVLPFNVILLRTFFQTIPGAFRESALIDGASETRILLSIVAPISTAGLATIGLFIALGYWNNWFLSLMLISARELFTLQFLLREIISNILALQDDPTGQSIGDMPTESLKMATAVITIGPIILVYPFIQRYFISGITLGGIKG